MRKERQMIFSHFDFDDREVQIVKKGEDDEDSNSLMNNIFGVTSSNDVKFPKMKIDAKTVYFGTKYGSDSDLLTNKKNRKVDDPIKLMF